MFTVYALVSETTDKIYIGQTKNIEKRLRQHNGTETHLGKFTRQNKGPWKLLYTEKYHTRSEAIHREKQLKSFQGRKFIKNLIKGARP